MSHVDFLLLILLVTTAVGGHLAFWVMLFNRLHAMGLPCRAIDLGERLLMLAAIAIPLLVVVAAGPRLLTRQEGGEPGGQIGEHLQAAPEATPRSLAIVYIWFSLAVAAVKLPRWLRSRLRRSDENGLMREECQRIDAATQCDSPLLAKTWKGWSAGLPGNQSLQLEVNHKQLLIPRLPRLLDGLTIGHLSDLHFTGHLLPAYFQLVMDQLKSLECDLVVLTGDVIDERECLPWIQEVLGRLEMPGRSFCILGNHDQRAGSAEEIRGELQRAGWMDLGGRATVIDLRAVRILLAGNERPWYSGLPQSVPQSGAGSNMFRLLLSHSPDQFEWAVEQQYDLVLAGHTHGGQIRFPVWGPMVVPSRYGVRFASGVFREAETVMHVSRGISGLHPLRWNCLPELTRLELRAPQPAEKRREDLRATFD